MTPEQLEIMKATETQYETGKAWTFKHARLSMNDQTGQWFALIGRAEGKGLTPGEAIDALFTNMADPDYEPIPF